MSLWDGIKNIMNVSDDDYEEEDYEETEEEQQPAPKKEKESVKREPVRSSERRTGKTVSFNPADNMKLYLSKPERFEDVTSIADQYCARRTIVLNLEKTDRDLARRIIDFMSGVAYAKNGDIRKAANNTFIIAPSDVDVTGENIIEDYDNSNIY